MPALRFTTVLLLLSAICRAETVPDQTAFDCADAASANWKTVFSDSCTNDWRKKWFLDGEVGTVTNTPNGMILTAGPEWGNNADHMVLWTKESFEGDVRIDYEFTRLDSETRAVNILYIEATGSGEGPYATDIAEWSELRKVPAMKTYFNNVNVYHISYAAFPNSAETNAYIRARRYMPGKSGLKGSDLLPDYFSDTLFLPDVPHKITVIKKDRDLFMRVSNATETAYFHWHNDQLPPITEGRIGLRLMFTRKSCFKDFRICQP